MAFLAKISTVYFGVSFDHKNVKDTKTVSKTYMLGQGKCSHWENNLAFLQFSVGSITLKQYSQSHSQ